MRTGHRFRKAVDTMLNRRPAIRVLTLLLGLVTPAAAQTPLSLADAVARARAHNPDAGVGEAAERAATERVAQARAGFWPRVDATESWQRGNQPVFVFGSLLAQGRFAAENFALAALNRPDAVDNFRSAVTVEQPLFDAVTRASVTAAGLGREMAAASRLLVDQDLAMGVTGAYGRVLAAMGAHRSADAAIETARADRERAGNRRDAGLVTDADVLQLDVHVSRARERQIRATLDERVARARLNQLMGEPLSAVFRLDDEAGGPVVETSDLASLETEAIGQRPDIALATLQHQLARTQHTVARAAFLPQVSAQSGWEWNGGAWGGRQSSWIVGAVARVNLFRGFGDRARLAEAAEQARRRTLERDKAVTAVRLDVHEAVAKLEAARASVAVSADTAAQARESQRIIRDRYEAGLADVVSLLRAAEAVAQAETQQIDAQVAVLVETAGLERALGRR
jgi:outer membrane protein TolC